MARISELEFQSDEFPNKILNLWKITQIILAKRIFCVDPSSFPYEQNKKYYLILNYDCYLLYKKLSLLF